MQISRHWRMNPVRYRLQGVRYQTKEGEVLYSIQGRPLTEEQVNEVLLEASHEARMARVREIRRKMIPFVNKIKKLRNAA